MAEFSAAHKGPFGPGRTLPLRLSSAAVVARIARAAAVAMLSGALLGGCGAAKRGAPRTLRVPAQYHSVQSAVTASRPGDTILISPGIYHEAVTVSRAHKRITIRGINRNSVILDGDSGSLVNGITVNADGVAVENLTIRRYAVNGLVFVPSANGYGTVSGELTGWRGSYVTAYDNGLYGVYALDARSGEFDHVYTSGQPDSGIYVGQCNPCAATVRASAAVDNAVGYEDTDATGVTVTGTVMRQNRIGALLDSNNKEQQAPQTRVVLEHDTLTANDNPHAPTGDQGFGAGVAISGGDNNLISANRVSGQPLGVLITNAETDVGGYPATDNRVQDNSLSDQELDLALLTGSSTQGNCFLGNRPRRTFPRDVERLTTCGRGVPISGPVPSLPANPPPVSYLTIPAPPAQPTMP